MKRKLLPVFLSIICALCFALGLTACDALQSVISGSDSLNSEQNNEQTDGEITDNTEDDNGNDGSADESDNTDISDGENEGDDEQDGDTEQGSNGETEENENSDDNADGNKDEEKVLTPSEGLKYTLLSDNTYEVSGIGTCTDTDIVIPDTYNGLPVTSIDDKAFYRCTSLLCVTIPDSVTSIGDYAFTSCYSLVSVTIPNSVIIIGNYAFWNCCSLKSVYIGSGVTSIGDCAFAFCTLLESVTIGDCVTSIGDYAFWNCCSLKSVDIGNGVTSISKSAFKDCTSLEYNEYENGYYLGNSSNKYVVLIEVIDTSIGSFTINKNTKIIYYDAFYRCTALTSITIPNSVTTIGDYAFEYCTALTSIAVSDSVTSIGRDAFYNTGYYNDINNWEDGVLYIGNYLIKANTSISGSYTIKDGTMVIADVAFYNCTSLESVTIGSGVTSIGEYAFNGCTSLTSVTFENTSGWYVAKTAGATSGTDIISSDLENTSTAAKYLKSTYDDYYWYRSED